MMLSALPRLVDEVVCPCLRWSEPMEGSWALAVLQGPHQRRSPAGRDGGGGGGRGRKRKKQKLGLPDQCMVLQEGSLQGPRPSPPHLNGGVRDGRSDFDREAACKGMASGREAEREGVTSRPHPHPHIHSATAKSGRREL